MAATNLDGYTGFSSKNYERNKSYVIHDVEVVKADLLNHIFTRKGERVRMSSFGTRIPDLQFEPLIDESLDIVKEDLLTVFNYDRRVILNDLRVFPLYEEKRVVAVADLFFIYLNFNSQLDINIEFDKQ